MLWTTTNFPKGKVLVDSWGDPVPMPKTFNDETFEVECFVFNYEGKLDRDENDQAILRKVVILGAHIVDRSR